MAYDYDETYTFPDKTTGEVGWDYVGPDHTGLKARNTDGAWCWTDTGSPSSNTGPPSGVACVYTETSSPVAVDDEFFMTLATAVSAATYGLYVTLDRCTYGVTQAHLYFEAYNGTAWVSIDDWAGDSTTTFTSEGPYDFTSYSNADFKIRFRTIVAGTKYKNDMAVDTVRIYGDAKGGEEFQKTLSDTTSLTDSISRIGSFYKALSENQTLSDSIIKSTSFYRILTDTSSLSDSIDTLKAFVKELTESLSLTDGFERKWTIYKILSESISIIDSIQKEHYGLLTQVTILHKLVFGA